jgi:molybdopterin converting factor small subunit
MKYNSELEPLKISEYGRNIQKMVDYAKTIKDKEERTQFAHKIVKTMASIVGNGKYNNQKYWDHLYILSDGELDIDWPVEVNIKYLHFVPERISYKEEYNSKFRYYGRIIEEMINKAIEMPDGDEKNELLRHLIMTMKKLYMYWNNRMVTDDIIKNHINTLSQGKLKIPEKIFDTTNVNIIKAS